MKRRHRKTFGFARVPVAALLLAASFLLPASSANASDAARDLAAVSYILPLHKPEPADAAFPERGLNFGDPIDLSKARMTSGFGWRTHPVLKDKRFHKGVDYAAPKGTPVYATEDGIVGRAGWRGNYGKLVTIKHSDHV